MLAAIPYPHIPALELGPLTLHPFGFLVGVAIVLGTMIADRRAARLGLDQAVIADVAIWVVVWGFIGAHLYSAVFYFPERIVENPLYLFMVWDGISSFGGFIGAISAAVWYFYRTSKLVWRDGRIQRIAVPRVPFFPYAEALIYGFAFAWIFGRLGCTVAFDHPGLQSDFALAMPFPAGREEDLTPLAAWFRAALPGFDLSVLARPREDVVRHNLGFYEHLWALGMSAFFLWRGRRPAFSGYFLTTFVIFYAPIRFMFDFLRTADVRYAGLTPGQYAAIALFVLAIAFRFQRRSVGDVMVPDGEVHVMPDGTPAVPPEYFGAAGQGGGGARKR